jgi:hypothetical protein
MIEIPTFVFVWAEQEVADEILADSVPNKYRHDSWGRAQVADGPYQICNEDGRMQVTVEIEIEQIKAT